MSNVTPADDAEVLAAWLQNSATVTDDDAEIADLLQCYFWRLAISNPILIFPARCGGKIDAKG